MSLSKEQVLKTQQAFNTRRSRTIAQYDRELQFRKKLGEFFNYIKTTIERNGEYIWVDKGGGVGVAGRQAKILLERAGIQPEKLKNYVVDPIGFSEADLRYDLTQRNNSVDINIQTELANQNITIEQLLDEKYAPIEINTFAETFQAPEQSHLVTGIYLLRWAQDPLKIIENSVNDAKEGSIIAFNDMDNILLNEEPFHTNNKIHLNITSDIIGYYLFNEQERLQEYFTQIRNSGTEIILQRIGNKKFSFNFDSKILTQPATSDGYIKTYFPNS